MTDPRDIAKLCAEMRARAEKAKPGRWHWWTSNSWRRLSTEVDGRLAKDGEVLCPVVASDGHPDIVIHAADMAYIETAHPANVLAVLAYANACERRATAAEAALDKLKDELAAAREMIARLCDAFIPLAELWKELCVDPDVYPDDELTEKLHPIMRFAARALADVKEAG